MIEVNIQTRLERRQTRHQVSLEVMHIAYYHLQAMTIIAPESSLLKLEIMDPAGFVSLSRKQ